MGKRSRNLKIAACIFCAIFFIRSPLENPALNGGDEGGSASTSNKPRPLGRGSRRLISPSAFAADGPEVTAIHVSGTVTVCAVDENACKTIEEGEILEAGDKIKTSRDSYAELVFDEDQENVIRIEADTTARLTLEDNEKLEISVGEVFVSIGKLPAGSSFEIRTPTVVAGARGTEWTTRVDELENTIVEAYRDSPYVRCMGEDGRWRPEVLEILPGHMTTIKRFQRPAPPVKLSEQRQRRWNAMRAQIRNHAAETKIKRRSPDWLKRRDPRKGVIRRQEQRRHVGRSPAPDKRTPDRRRQVQTQGAARKY